LPPLVVAIMISLPMPVHSAGRLLAGSGLPVQTLPCDG
jgi:hypothetical protein